MKRILVTGSRDWPESERQVVIALVGGMADGQATIVVGDHPRGVDRIVRDYLPYTEKHDADWNKHGLAAGPIRNQAMVDSGVSVCLAFFWTPSSKGTRDCATRARARFIPTYEIHAGTP